MQQQFAGERKGYEIFCHWPLSTDISDHSVLTVDHAGAFSCSWPQNNQHKRSLLRRILLYLFPAWQGYHWRLLLPQAIRMVRWWAVLIILSSRVLFRLSSQWFLGALGFISPRPLQVIPGYLPNIVSNIFFTTVQYMMVHRQTRLIITAKTNRWNIPVEWNGKWNVHIVHKNYGFLGLRSRAKKLG